MPDRLPDLWERWLTRKDYSARDSLCREFLPMAQRLAAKAKRKFADNVRLDDLESYAYTGLLRALNNFDPAKGISFEAYARASINGVILDELRTTDWAPRSLRRRVREIDAARREIEQLTGRQATLEEVAVRLDTTVTELEAVAEALVKSERVSTDELLPSGTPKHDPAHVDTTPVDPLLLEPAVRVLRGLPPLDLLIVTLYYHEGLTLADAGAVAGISEAHASKVHSRAMTQVRSALAQALLDSGSA